MLKRLFNLNAILVKSYCIDLPEVVMGSTFIRTHFLGLRIEERSARIEPVNPSLDTNLVTGSGQVCLTLVI